MMKTVINNESTNKLEFFKRILYSFQVLIVGIAIPALFMIGISTKEQNRPAEIKERAGHQIELTEKPSVVLNVARI